jgi:hypothetical protein
MGVTMSITGGEGTVLIYSADGTELVDYTNAAPFTASGGGHTYTVIYRGLVRFTIVTRDHQWTESGLSQQIFGSHYVVDGAPQPDFAGPVEPGSGTYTCSGSSVTFVSVVPFPYTETFKK